MANTIKFKRASGSDPSASDLAIGEPGLRTDTAELFFKKDDGTVAKVSGGGGGPNFKYLELRNAANNGAASFPGNDFTLVTAGTTTAISPSAANTLLVSVSGVIQKPNAGTSTSGITGFIIDGSRFKTATNLPAAPDFIVFQESGGIGEPSDNTVTSAKIVDGAIVNADINASAAIAGSKISPDFGSQNIITTGSITGTGNLTIDTNTLHVDSSNNRVGIGTTSPNNLLNIHGVIETNSFDSANGQGGRFTSKGLLIGDAFTAGKTSSDDRNSIIWNERGLDLVFATNDTERMKIDSSGQVFIGCTSTPSASTTGFAVLEGGAGKNFIVTAGGVTGNNEHHEFYNPNGKVGSITTSGTSTAFNTSSDYRLKENAVAISDGITRLKTLKPYRFNFKTDASTTVDGFFAHEVTAVPEAITGEKDGMKPETYYQEGDTLPSGKVIGDVKTYSSTKPEYQGIDQSKLVPLLVAALQEAIGRIEALEAK